MSLLACEQILYGLLVRKITRVYNTLNLDSVLNCNANESKGRTAANTLYVGILSETFK